MLAVETEGLTRTFGSFVAVNHVDLNISQGSIYGFLGPNGSGKSTTIRMLCGILEPSSGNGRVHGLDIKKQAETIKTQIGYMSQKFSLYDDLTVVENLEFYAGMYGLSGRQRQVRIAEMLEMAGLKHRHKELTSNLSGGWKQRLALGCSIVHQPPILFLDEPTGGVDPKSRRMFWEIIYRLAEAGTTVMVTTHFMDEAEHCDKIGFIFEGNLIADATPDQLKESLPGVLWEIPSPDPMHLIAEVERRFPELLDIYPYGTGVHVLAGQEQDFNFAAFQGTVISPSLEDVFVFLVKSKRKEAEG